MAGDVQKLYAPPSPPVVSDLSSNQIGGRINFVKFVDMLNAVATAGHQLYIHVDLVKI